MKKLQSRFVFSTTQRNGIFLLVIIMVLLLGGMIWLNSSTIDEEEIIENEELQNFRDYVDSLKLIQKNNKSSYKIYPFNPNYISDYKGYKLGMSPKQIDKLHNFRKKGEWVNSVAQFQAVTGVSDSLLSEISPYFKFPAWVIEKQQNTNPKKSNKKRSYADKDDLNKVSTKGLQAINGVGEVLAKRIVRYRTKINGFVSEEQLKDIYGLPYETEQSILEVFAVKTPPKIKKLDINTATLIQLSETVYLNYELAREIINYRTLHEGISSFEELSKIKEFPNHKIDRLKLYLKIN